jgi:hypothetical protein
MDRRVEPPSGETFANLPIALQATKKVREQEHEAGVARLNFWIFLSPFQFHLSSTFQQCATIIAESTDIRKENHSANARLAILC